LRNMTLLFALIGVLVATVVGLGTYFLLQQRSAMAAATQTAIVAAQATGTAEQLAVATAETAVQPSPTVVSQPTEPPTAVLPTAIPPMEVPPTAVLPTAIPPTEVPPTEPPTAVPPTEVPPTAVPSNTPTPKPIVGASCTVNSGANIHVRPSDNSNIGSLTRGETFFPEAKSSDDITFVWVRVSATASHPAGWVYAGKAPSLVACTGLEHVSVETP
jgi:hypothetical protein